MKNSTMLLLGLGVAAGVYLYVSKPSAPRTMIVTGWQGKQVTVQADPNMTDQEIGATQTQWNSAASSDDVATLRQIISNMTASSHPLAAQGLAGVLNDALTHQQGTAQGYSAGAYMTAMGYSAGALHPLVRVHRLAMAGAL